MQTRLRAGLVGGLLGSIIGILAPLWWPHVSMGTTMAAFGGGATCGLILGVTLGPRVLGWVGALVDAVL